MASNFQIKLIQNTDELQLKLYGDFDGTSACELLNIIKNYYRNILRIYIHTEGLNYVHPFGRDIFNRRLGIRKNRGARIVFKGKKAHDFYYKSEPWRGGVENGC